MFSATVTYPQQPLGTPRSTQFTAEQNAALTEARQLSQRVVQLHGSRKFDEALPLARRALELRRGVLGENNSLVADALANLAGLHLAKGEFERAESLFKQALSSYDNVSVVSSQSAYVLQVLTYLRWIARDYSKAEFYGERAIGANEKVHGINSKNLLDPLQNLIKIYMAKGDVEKTEALYQRIVSLAEDNKERLSGDLAQLLVLYRCSHAEVKQNADLFAIDRRIEQLLGWQTGTQQMPVSGGVLNGKALSLPKPPYPELARMNRASGLVVVEIEIDECGKVAHAEALSGPVELKLVAINAARKASFSPTLVGLIPVRVKGVIQYNFVAPRILR
ncbi:MAG TPA: TonB family protein [Pyrinomonadaceae bacterium]